MAARLMSKQKIPPWLICQKGGTLYSDARYVALWASCLTDQAYKTIPFVMDTTAPPIEEDHPPNIQAPTITKSASRTDITSVLLYFTSMRFEISITRTRQIIRY